MPGRDDGSLPGAGVPNNVPNPAAAAAGDCSLEQYIEVAIAALIVTDPSLVSRVDGRCLPGYAREIAEFAEADPDHCQALGLEMLAEANYEDPELADFIRWLQLMPPAFRAVLPIEGLIALLNPLAKKRAPRRRAWERHLELAGAGRG
jgi:hypothetical protein